MLRRKTSVRIFQLLAFLGSCEGGDGVAVVTRREIAQTMGLGDNQEKAVMRQARQLGLVVVEPRFAEHGGQTGNAYRLTPRARAMLGRMEACSREPVAVGGTRKLPSRSER